MLQTGKEIGSLTYICLIRIHDVPSAHEHRGGDDQCAGLHRSLGLQRHAGQSGRSGGRQVNQADQGAGRSIRQIRGQAGQSGRSGDRQVNQADLVNYVLTTLIKNVLDVSKLKSKCNIRKFTSCILFCWFSGHTVSLKQV